MEHAYYLFSKLEKEELLSKSPQISALKDGVGFALFGIGRAGIVHFENIIKNPRIQLLYLIDEYQSCCQQLIEKWNLKRTCVLQLDEMGICFNDARVDVIVIATPTITHEKLLRRALSSGKAVLCEAPISTDLYVTKLCFAAAESSKLNRPLLCGYNRRFDPTIKLLKERIDFNEIGKIRTIRCCTRERILPSISYLKVSGGLIQDMAIHDIDTICWLISELPVSVYVETHAMTKEIVNLKDIDSLVILMKFKSGIIGTIETCRNAKHGFDQKVEVFGSDGVLVSENPKSSNISHIKIEGVVSENYPLSFGYRFSESYAEEINHFLKVLQKKEKVLVTPNDVLNLMRIAMACEQSVKTKMPIILDEQNWNEKGIEV